MEPGRRMLCAYYRHGDPIRTSTDAGRTWRAVASDAIPPPARDLPLRLQHFQEPGRGTTGDFDAVRAVHVLDRMTGRLLKTHRYTNLEGGWAFLLPEGVMVASADGHGVLMGTDPSNRVLAYRRGAFTPTTNFAVLGRQLVATSTRWPKSVLVSTDQARTWRRVSLRLPPSG